MAAGYNQNILAQKFKTKDEYLINVFVKGSCNDQPYLSENLKLIDVTSWAIQQIKNRLIENECTSSVD